MRSIVAKESVVWQEHTVYLRIPLKCAQVNSVITRHVRKNADVMVVMPMFMPGVHPKDDLGGGQVLRVEEGGHNQEPVMKTILWILVVKVTG